MEESTNIITIPGHQQWAQMVKWEFDRAVREITVTRGDTLRGVSREALSNLRSRLDRSGNPYLHSAGDLLEEALLSDDRFKSLAALRRGSLNILSRIEQIESIILSVMQRYNKLDAHRQSNEQSVRQMYFEVVRSFGKWQGNQEARTVTAENLAVFARPYLDSFITNPYKLRSNKLGNLADLVVVMETEGADWAGRIIVNATKELNMWKEEVDEDVKGRFQDRFPVKN